MAQYNGATREKLLGSSCGNPACAFSTTSCRCCRTPPALPQQLVWLCRNKFASCDGLAFFLGKAVKFWRGATVASRLEGTFPSLLLGSHHPPRLTLSTGAWSEDPVENDTASSFALATSLDCPSLDAFFFSQDSVASYK